MAVSEPDADAEEQSVCQSCEALGMGGAGQLIPVWEDPEDYQHGENPDYIGCTACCTMRSVESEVGHGE